MTTDASSTASSPDETTTTERTLRRGLIGIAAIIVAGTAVELASRHHWTQLVQWIAWAALVLLIVAIVLLAREPSAAQIRTVRVICVIVAITAALGVVEHVIGNYDAGPLDAQYGENWDSMSAVGRWWAALIQAVGPSPALAPGVLVLASLCLWLATVGHRASD